MGHGKLPTDEFLVLSIQSQAMTEVHGILAYYITIIKVDKERDKSLNPDYTTFKVLYILFPKIFHLHFSIGQH